MCVTTSSAWCIRLKKKRALRLGDLIDQDFSMGAPRHPQRAVGSTDRDFRCHQTLPFPLPFRQPKTTDLPEVRVALPALGTPASDMAHTQNESPPGACSKFLAQVSTPLKPNKPPYNHAPQSNSDLSSRLNLFHHICPRREIIMLRHWSHIRRNTHSA